VGVVDGEPDIRVSPTVYPPGQEDHAMEGPVRRGTLAATHAARKGGGDLGNRHFPPNTENEKRGASGCASRGGRENFTSSACQGKAAPDSKDELGAA